MYIFIDESGDLGFNFDSKKKQGPSRFFVLIAAKVTQPKQIYRVMKRARQRKLKKEYKKKPELKFSNTGPEIRRRILEDLARCEIELYYVIIDKKKVKPELHDQKVILYSYLLKILFEKCFKYAPADSKINIIFDRVFTQTQQEALKIYLLTQNKAMLGIQSKLNITHDNSQNDPGLQATDFLVGAMAQKYERGNPDYINIVKRKVEVEKKLF